jgi:glutamate synthase (NADPH/NADH) small chain
VIIGGGDTGSDCLGTCHRDGAREVHQLELLPEPPASRAPHTPWPQWPMQLRTSHAHEEGGSRRWSVSTTAFEGRGEWVERLRLVRVQAAAVGGTGFEPVAGSEFTLDADVVLLAMGFTGPRRSALLARLGVAVDGRGNLATDGEQMTSVPGVFAAGDARRGASLIVWAIREGRDAAAAIGRYLARADPGRRAHVPAAAHPSGRRRVS